MNKYLFILLLFVSNNTLSQNWPLDGNQTWTPQFEIINSKKMPEYTYTYYYDKTSIRIYTGKEVRIVWSRFADILTYRAPVLCYKYEGINVCGWNNNGLHKEFIKEPEYNPPIKEEDTLIRLFIKIEYSNPIKLTNNFIYSSLEFNGFFSCKGSGVLLTPFTFYSGNYLQGAEYFSGTPQYVNFKDRGASDVDFYISIFEKFKKYC